MTEAPPATGGRDDRYGWPASWWAWLARHRPPGPFAERVWRSPLRGPWLTSVLGFVLLLGLPVVTLTGLLSYIAYQPQFAGNAFPAQTFGLSLPSFAWPTSPAWLYRLNQGVHVTLGLALVPVVLAKLWSVMPKLFAWPPARSLAAVMERLSLTLLVGSTIFEMVTGVLNIQYDYIFRFDFYTAHYYGAWVFAASFVVHVALKLPVMIRTLRGRRLRDELRTPLARTVADPPDPDGLAPLAPAPPTISRRGALGLVGGASLAVTALTIGQTLSDRLRFTALLAPRGRSYGNGPNDFQVNRTAASAQIDPAQTGATWRLTVRGARQVALDRAQLLAMPQHTAELPIACVEGWSTVQRWSGVRLRDLLALAGDDRATHAIVRSLERNGTFNQATLNAGQMRDSDSLLALRVNGADISPDHGFPARIIVPALPGVHNTKWVREIELRS